MAGIAPITMATPVKYRLPTMAGHIPPSEPSTAPRGDCVRNSQLTEEPPFQKI